MRFIEMELSDRVVLRTDFYSFNLVLIYKQVDSVSSSF